MRSAIALTAAFLAVACLSPSAAERRDVTAITADRDMAAAVGTWTVRAYQPVVADSSMRNSLSSQPTLQFGQAPTWLVASGDSGYVTVIGPYLNPLTGRAEVTRIESRMQNGKMVATWYTRALKSGQATRGTFDPMPSMVVAAN